MLRTTSWGQSSGNGRTCAAVHPTLKVVHSQAATALTSRELLSVDTSEFPFAGSAGKGMAGASHTHETAKRVSPNKRVPTTRAIRRQRLLRWAAFSSAARA